MNPSRLTRRERQIMDALFRMGSATAAEVRDALPDPPTYSAVRAQLRLLEEKGHISHTEDGPRYVYAPAVPREKARRSAMRHVLKTFFDDSPAQAVAALLDDTDLSDEDYDDLSRLIEEAREQGR